MDLLGSDRPPNAYERDLDGSGVTGAFLLCCADDLVCVLDNRSKIDDEDDAE